MSLIRQKLNAMTVRVSSPDGGIEGILKGGREASISFRGENYYRYEAGTLSVQLAGLLRSWFAGYDQGRLAIREEAGRPVAETAGPHWNRTVRDFRTELLNTKCEGESDREFVRVSGIGRRDFTVTLASDALDELDEDDFAREFCSAVSDYVADLRMVSDMLKREHFDGR